MDYKVRDEYKVKHLGVRVRRIDIGCWQDRVGLGTEGVGWVGACNCF